MNPTDDTQNTNVQPTEEAAVTQGNEPTAAPEPTVTETPSTPVVETPVTEAPADPASVMTNETEEQTPQQ